MRDNIEYQRKQAESVNIENTFDVAIHKFICILILFFTYYYILSYGIIHCGLLT